MISREQQRLVIEKLYRSSDSITSTKKFNEKYGSSVGHMGEESMRMTDFGRKMKKTDFMSSRVEQAMREVTGRSVDLESL
ncbi:hypothetical protein HOB10_05205 [Candidatus Parcubacteria bacterium]|jgi:hypothetical protein|nr:hypothetical protein [Candidatus Parcubacteria bacterium]